MTNVHVLVVNSDSDERCQICDLIRSHHAFSLRESCTDGRSAIECILRDTPDLVVLRIEMPEIGGLDVVRTIGPDRMPPVVFIASSPDAAVEAFDVGAIDYLVQPVEADRLQTALQRAQKHVRYRCLDALSDRMVTLLQGNGMASSSPHPVAAASNGAASNGATSNEPSSNGAPSAHSSEPPPPMDRIAVQRRGAIELVPVDDVRFFEADGSYVKVHTAERTHLIRERMKKLEARLPNRRFCRIHRSTIVHLPDVAALEPTSQGDMVARLCDGTRLRVSRSRRDELEARLGIG